MNSTKQHREQLENSTTIQQAFLFYQGKYYVEYTPTQDHPDRMRSRCMPYRTAKEYAEIFGGTVHRDPRFPTLFQRIMRLFK